MKTAFFAYSQGCPRSAVDAALLFRYFDENGWRTDCRVEDADLVLVNTCGVHQEAENLGLAAIEALHRKRRPDSTLVVLGCLAGINPEGFVDRFQAVALPPVRVHELDGIIQAAVPLKDLEDVNLVQDAVRTARKNLSTVVDGNGTRRERMTQALGADRVMALLKHTLRPGARTSPTYSLRVAWGCMGECSYCAIRHAAGPLRSKPLEKVLAELDAGLSRGYRAFELVAGDVGCYGQDAGTSIAVLLREIFARPDAFSLMIHDLNPQWLIRYQDEVVPILTANSARIRMLVLPMQSGCDRVLELMRRDYTSNQVVDCMRRLRQPLEPPLNIVTHVLVGFPGETDDDFAQTLRLLRAAEFDRVDVYHYTHRPNTDSLRLPDPVSREVAERRADAIAEEFDARYSLWPRRPPERSLPPQPHVEKRAS